MPYEIIKKIGGYVIAHELLHFNAPDYGKLCKSLMLVYLDDYEKLEKKIKMRYGETTK